MGSGTKEGSRVQKASGQLQGMVCYSRWIGRSGDRGRTRNLCLLPGIDPKGFMRVKMNIALRKRTLSPVRLQTWNSSGGFVREQPPPPQTSGRWWGRGGSRRCCSGRRSGGGTEADRVCRAEARRLGSAHEFRHSKSSCAMRSCVSSVRCKRTSMVSS